MKTNQYYVSLLVSLLLVFLPVAASPQVDPGYGDVRIYGIIDPAGDRLGIIVVVGRSGRGFTAGHEYWTFSETALLEIAEVESLEFVNLAEGQWDDPWIVETLDWEPEKGAVAWVHPSKVAWTGQDQMVPPEVAGGAYFGNATQGGLMIQYVDEGPASLTWYKLTEDTFMQLEYGALFVRDEETPTAGFWWRGSIETAG